MVMVMMMVMIMMMVMVRSRMVVVILMMTCDAFMTNTAAVTDLISRAHSPAGVRA